MLFCKLHLRLWCRNNTDVLENFVGCEKHVMWLYLLCFDFSAKEHVQLIYITNQNSISHNGGQDFFSRGLFRDYLGLFLQEKDEPYSAVPQL